MRISSLLDWTDVREPTQAVASEILGINARAFQRWAERFGAQEDDRLSTGVHREGSRHGSNSKGLFGVHELCFGELFGDFDDFSAQALIADLQHGLDDGDAFLR
jgi:hypothetical protein